MIMTLGHKIAIVLMIVQILCMVIMIKGLGSIYTDMASMFMTIPVLLSIWFIK